MRTSDLEKLINVLNQVKELKDEVEEHERDDEDECVNCKIIESLNDDLQAFQKWLWGDNDKLSKKKAMKLWHELHPGYPLPRILQSEHTVHPEVRNYALWFDAYLIYLFEKRKVKNETV